MSATEPARRTWLSWSSGKDSAWALQRLRRDASVEVVALVTTVTREFDRVSMHGVRSEILRVQAERVGLPLRSVEIPYPCPNERYESAMRELLAQARAEGVEAFAFGDLFLRDVREYREARLRGTGIRPIFPLWGSETGTLAREMIAGGLKARLACVDPRTMPRELAGREFDEELLGALPPGVDPCGERGEFHTVVYDAPGFRRPIELRAGEVVERDRFIFADFSLAPGTR